MTLTLPDVPRGWAWSRIDRLASVTARIGWKALTATEYRPEGYTFLSTPNIKTGDIDFENVNYIPEWRYFESPELMLKPDDVLLVKDGNTLGIANIVRHLPRPATVNGSIAILRPGPVEPRFLRYVLESEMIQGLIGSLRAGMGVPHLFQADIKKLPVPIPPIELQRAIADYLDAETARIDALKEKKRRMIELLFERRRVLISDAVEGRLSIAGWRGDGGHGSWRPLKRFCPMPPDYGLNIRADDYRDQGVRLIRTSDILANCTLRDDHAAVFVEPTAANGLLLQPGDLLLSRSGTLGRCLRYTGPAGACTFAGYLVRFRALAGVDPRFLAYCAQTRFFAEAIESDAIQSTISNFNAERYGQVLLPWCELAVQRAIADYLDAATGRAEAMIQTIERQVGLLVEHRQALITAAVTGALAIPGATA